MHGIKQQISNDLKTALKAGDKNKVETLRFLQSVLQNKEIEKRGISGGELTDEEVERVLMSEAKKRKEAIRAYKEGGRAELAEKENQELSIIEQYLPKQMSREETEQKIKEILEREKPDNFGLAMKVVMTELRGKADSQMIADIVKEKFLK